MSQPRPDREQRRRDILDAARETFCEHGYEQAAVSEIAARVGVVEGTVYRYFESKHELLMQVLTDWYHSMFGDYADALAGVNGAKTRLRLLIWRHLRTIRDAPELCRLMFREARDDIGAANSELRKLNRRYTRFLVDVLEDGMAQGEFRTGLPPALFRDLVYGGIEHYCWRYLSGQGELDIDLAAEQISDIFCHGIGMPGNDLGRETQRLSTLVSRMEQLLPEAPQPSHPSSNTRKS